VDVHSRSLCFGSKAFTFRFAYIPVTCSLESLEKMSGIIPQLGISVSDCVRAIEEKERKCIRGLDQVNLLEGMVHDINVRHQRAVLRSNQPYAELLSMKRVQVDSVVAMFEAWIYGTAGDVELSIDALRHVSGVEFDRSTTGLMSRLERVGPRFDVAPYSFDVAEELLDAEVVDVPVAEADDDGVILLELGDEDENFSQQLLDVSGSFNVAKNILFKLFYIEVNEQKSKRNGRSAAGALRLLR